MQNCLGPLSSGCIELCRKWTRMVLAIETRDRQREGEGERKMGKEREGGEGRRGRERAFEGCHDAIEPFGKSKAVLCPPSNQNRGFSLYFVFYLPFSGEVGNSPSLALSLFSFFLFSLHLIYCIGSGLIRNDTGRIEPCC